MFPVQLPVFTEMLSTFSLLTAHHQFIIICTVLIVSFKCACVRWFAPLWKYNPKKNTPTTSIKDWTLYRLIGISWCNFLPPSWFFPTSVSVGLLCICTFSEAISYRPSAAWPVSYRCSSTLSLLSLNPLFSLSTYDSENMLPCPIGSSSFLIEVSYTLVL